MPRGGGAGALAGQGGRGVVLQAANNAAVSRDARGQTRGFWGACLEFGAIVDAERGGMVMLRSAVKALKARGIRAVSGRDITRPAAVADVSEYAAVQANQPIHAAH